MAISYHLTVRARAFNMPPVASGLVCGKDSLIASSDLAAALQLLAENQFRAVAVDDDVVGHILIRRNLLRRVPEEKLVQFVLAKVKPLMTSKEILHLDLKVQVRISET